MISIEEDLVPVGDDDDENDENNRVNGLGLWDEVERQPSLSANQNNGDWMEDSIYDDVNGYSVYDDDDGFSKMMEDNEEQWRALDQSRLLALEQSRLESEFDSKLDLK